MHLDYDMNLYDDENNSKRLKVTVSMGNNTTTVKCFLSIFNQKCRVKKSINSTDPSALN